MFKRVIAMALCLVCLLLCFAACAKSENDKGAYIRMYLGSPVYDLDPLRADSKEALQIVSLLFQPLFMADEDGDVEPVLVEDYEYIVDEDENKYVLSLTLKKSLWSDGVAITATDAQYAFLRLFDTNTSHALKAALYDIKNARAIAAADEPAGHLGVIAKDQSTLEIEFEKDVDVDDFLLNLCHPALSPLRAEYIEKDPLGWSKSLNTNIVFSGPFIITSMNFTEKDGFVLERNSYYYRDTAEDALDETVTPYRLIVDFSTPADKQFANFNKDEKGALQYLGYIPLANRTEANAELFEDADIAFAPSTHVFYLNENALINGQPLFALANVRLALSKALDRENIAKALMFAVEADGLVPHTVLNRADKGASFRDKAESYIAATPAIEEAKQLLSEAGIKASDFSFTLTVNGSNEEHVKIGELAVAAWKALGFNVTLNKLSYEEVMDMTNPEKPVGTGIYENTYNTVLANGAFEAISLDLIAPAPTAFSYLAPFAKEFSGNAINFPTDIVNPTYQLTPHITGYDSEYYSQMIEAAYTAKNEKERAALLHEAEKLLMTVDMPVIPVVYNRTATLCGDDLSSVYATYYCPGFFMEAKLSNYWELAIRDGFVKEGSDE